MHEDLNQTIFDQAAGTGCGQLCAPEHRPRAKLGETTPMNEYAELGWNGKKTMLPMIEGSAGERAIDLHATRLWRKVEVYR